MLKRSHNIFLVQSLAVQNNQYPIKPTKMGSFHNQQHYLAEQFHIQDIQLIKANYEAALKIKRWRLIQKIPALSKRIRKEADSMIQESFLLYVDNYNVLLEEGFYSEMLTN